MVPAEQHICISTSDLFLLSEFLGEDVVYYFVRKANVISGDLVVCSHELVMNLIATLRELLFEKDCRFCELSFQQRIQLIDDLFETNNELRILRK